MEKFNFKKKYGQNFLNSDDILNSIVSSIEVSNENKIIEVGPGSGALTKKLINFGCNITAFEIDTTLKKYLDEIKSDNLKIVYEDFLNINLKDYFDRNDKIYVVANIPYYITTPIISKFIEEDFIPEAMVLMVQKEVAERLSAKSHSSDYGSITVILNYFFDIEYLFTVGREYFYPIPNVDSAVIKLSKKSSKVVVNDYKKFECLVQDAFKQKRKNLRNNLKNYNLDIVENILKKYSLDLTNRAEDLNYEIFVEIANNL